MCLCRRDAPALWWSLCPPPPATLDLLCFSVCLVDTALQVGSHEGRVGGQNPLPHPAVCAALDAPLALWAVCTYCQVTSQLFIQENPWVLLGRAVPSEYFFQSVCTPLSDLLVESWKMLRLSCWASWQSSSFLADGDLCCKNKKRKKVLSFLKRVTSYMR